MTAILFALAAGFLFGALTVAVRLGLQRVPQPVAGTVVISLMATTIALVVTAATGELDGFDPGVLWPFALIGLGVPGLSQMVFANAVRTAGPARAGVFIGMAPLVSAVIAIGALGERPHAVIGAATVLIVAGGAVLAWERTRPVDFKPVGILLALACAAMFGLRDNLVRLASDGREAEPFAAATVSLAAASIATLAWYLIVTRGSLPALAGLVRPFLVAGLSLGLAYAALVAAFDSGRVTVVAPLAATQGLWAVALSALVIGRAERIGIRLVVAAVLVVTGSVLVGIFR